MTMMEQKIGFLYRVTVIGADGRVKDESVTRNLMPMEAMNHLFTACFASGAQNLSWYGGLFKTAYEPDSADTMQRVIDSALEFTQYESATRPQIVFAPAANGKVIGAPALVTFTAPGTVYGGFLTTSPVKGSASGLLGSIARFPAPKQLQAGDTLKLSAEQYGIIV